MRFFPDGIGVLETGHPLLSRTPLQMAGNVWFVDYASGTDAVSPRGLGAEYPLKTLAQAVSNSASGDIILLRSTHNEPIDSNLNIGSKRLIILGEGRTNGVPLATLENVVPDNSMLEFSIGVRVINVRFIGSDDLLDPYPHLEINGGSQGSRVEFCQFESALENTTNPVVLLYAAQNTLFEDCVFKSTSETPDDPPNSLLSSYGAPATGITLKRCTFDGGNSGFSTGYAVDFTYFAITDLYMETVTLTNGAGIGIAVDSTGIAYNMATGTSRVDWLTS
jgi:hypothetical protein